MTRSITRALRNASPIALAAAVVIVTFVGWRAFYFLTDDAYIAFRYVSNWAKGWGLTWNPPPFRAVEGYTSFLWVAILRVVWAVTGVAPPVAANWLSLLFGYATLFLGYRFIVRMRLPASLEGSRLGFLALTLLATTTNRTFLTWLSSGLETALFNFCFTWWLYEGLTPDDQRGRGWVLRLSVSAALTALTRPDGLLAVAATVFILVVERFGREDRRASMWGAAALLAVLAHLVWRRLTYGVWLPNTYYAKYVSAWPESGLRYLASFGVEYGAWLWLVLAVAALVRGLARHLKARRERQPDAVAGWLARARRELLRLSRVAPIAVLVVHFAYYTLIIGGDHFEYRVYSHLVLLMFVSAVWLTVRITEHRWRASLLLVGLLVASYPVQWVHWSETRHLTRRDQTYVMIRPIAHRFPRPLRPLLRRWDRWQAWLTRHGVGVRHQEHKVFHDVSVAYLPSRAVGSRIRWQERAVTSERTVGVVGWVLAEVAVIDRLGLNDWVIARNPVSAKQKADRKMAHDRRPPPGYLDCFRPDLTIVQGQIVLKPRPLPLSDNDIRACEARKWPP